MTVVIRWWKRTKIWGKIRDTCALCGTGTTIGLQANGVDGWVTYLVSGATLAGTLVGIWMADSNQDGIADIFQDDPPQDNVERK